MNRIMRIVVGLALIGYAIFSGNAWFYLGVIPLLTGVINYCPMEKLMGGCKDGECSTGSCCSSDADKEENSCCSTDNANEKTSCCTTPDEQVKEFQTSQETKKSCCSSTNDGEIMIKILGTGCPKCIALKKVVDEAILEFDNVKVEKIEDINEIMSYNIVGMPGFVINEKVLETGKVLNVEEVKNYIKKEQK